MNHSMHQKLTSLIVRQVLPFERVPLCRLLTSLLAVTFDLGLSYERRKKREKKIEFPIDFHHHHVMQRNGRREGKKYLSPRERWKKERRKEMGEKSWTSSWGDIGGNGRFFISKKKMRINNHHQRRCPTRKESKKKRCAIYRRKLRVAARRSSPKKQQIWVIFWLSRVDYVTRLKGLVTCVAANAQWILEKCFTVFGQLLAVVESASQSPAPRAKANWTVNLNSFVTFSSTTRIIADRDPKMRELFHVKLHIFFFESLLPPQSSRESRVCTHIYSRRVSELSSKHLGKVSQPVGSC